MNQRFCRTNSLLNFVSAIIPGKQKTGKRSSPFPSQDATSCLVFVSKSPSTGLVWNYRLSSILVLTVWLTGVTLRAMSSPFRKKDPSKTYPNSNEMKSVLEIWTSQVLGLFETKTSHDGPSWRSSDTSQRPNIWLRVGLRQSLRLVFNLSAVGVGTSLNDREIEVKVRLEHGKFVLHTYRAEQFDHMIQTIALINP